MLKTLGVIEVRLPSKNDRAILGRRLGCQSVIEWVVRRVTDCSQLEGVIVVACDTEHYHNISHLVPADVPVFLDESRDALSRIVRALEKYPAQSVVYIRGDNPFTDPTLVDRLVISAQSQAECDYASFCSRDGRPAVLAPMGIYAEWVRTSALRKAARSAKRTEDRDQVTRHIYSHPEKFNIRLIPAPAEIDREDIRLSVDMEEDWENMLTIYEALGPEALEWQRIADLLDHQPALRKRMADLNRVCQQS